MKDWNSQPGGEALRCKLLQACSCERRDAYANYATAKAEHAENLETTEHAADVEREMAGCSACASAGGGIDTKPICKPRQVRWINLEADFVEHAHV